MLIREKVNWPIGISAFIISIAFIIFCAAPLQIELGMWGLAITELGILIIGLIPVFILKWKLSDIIPVKKIHPTQLISLLLLFISTYIAVNTISVITFYFFPEFSQVSADLTSFYSSLPFVLSLIIMSIMPGICEEVLHRGLILHTFKNCRNDKVIMIIMAVLFGVFHLDLSRFITTSIMGFVLTYIMIKTKNFLLPVIFHALNNAVSVSLSYGAPTNQFAPIQLKSIGIFLIISALSPFLFYTGCKLLTANIFGKKSKRTVIILTIILSVFGFGILALSPDGNSVTNFSFTEDVSSKTPPKVFDNIIIENESLYNLYVSISEKTATVITTVKFEHEDGEVVWNITGGDLFANKPTNLRSGKYKVIFTFQNQTEQIIPVDINFIIK